MRKKAIIKALRFTEEEYRIIEKKWKSSTFRSFSGFCRSVLFKETIVTAYRNRSLDDVLEQAIQIKMELTRLVHSQEESLKQLKTLKHHQEFSQWIIQHELEKVRILKKVEEVKLILHQIAEIWWH